MITNAGFRHNYDTKCESCYVYQGKSVGKTAKMLSFAFNFDPLPETPDTASYTGKAYQLEQQRCTEVLEGIAHEIKYDSETQQVTVRPYEVQVNPVRLVIRE